MAVVFIVGCTTPATTTTTAPPPTTSEPPPATVAPTTTVAPVDFTTPVDLSVVAGRIVALDSAAYVVDATGGDRTDIPEAVAGSQPTWSPDGTTVAFAAFDEATGPAIGIAEPGADATFIEAPFAPFYFHWSPDGSQLAFLGNGPSGLVELGFADLVAGTAARIDRGTPYYFDWSPDSSRIFSHAGVADTRLVGVDGEIVDVADDAGLYQAPQWTSGGVLQQVTVPATLSARGLRLRQDTDQALVLGPPGGESERLLTLEGLGAFESNGRDIAFTDSANPTTIVRGPLNVLAGGETVLISEVGVIAFEWSPDGSRLLFLEVLSSGSIPQAQWVVWERGDRIEFEAFTPSLTSVSAYFPFWDQYARSLTLWSPDGRAFVYSALDTETGRSDIFVQRVQADAPASRIGPGTWASWSS